MSKILLVFCTCCFLPMMLKAQRLVRVTDSAEQHIFGYSEIEYFEDPKGNLSFNEVTREPDIHKFIPSKYSTPQNYHHQSAYWFRIKILYPPKTTKNWVLEFFDQTIDEISTFMPDSSGLYKPVKLGSKYIFNNRFYKHKNFAVNLIISPKQSQTLYFRIKSHETANVIIVLRSVNLFINYALDEYFSYGIFYGMILVFGLYNLMMFFVMFQKQYLYYILYNLSIGVYEMCVDGIAYQYFWPGSPTWNHYAFGIALFLASIFSVMFAQSLLNVKVNTPRLNKLINGVIILRCIFFVFCITVDKSWFNYKIIEIIPLTLAYCTGCYILLQGYRPARFFVIGYTFLLLGFILKGLVALNIWIPVTAFDYYSLSFCFITEMVFISFAIGDKVRVLKMNEEIAQLELITQLKQNEGLKDNLNKNLEKQIQERTRQLVEKSTVIESQNKELISVNTLLQQRTEEISRMNTLLETDNTLLHSDIEKVTYDRVMSAEVKFEEFSKIYPDREACFKFLSALKWEDGYSCRKCNNLNYGHGHLPYSRRCTKCGYEESVIAYTILQNTRIPINKAFYLIFLIYSSKGKISSHKLSEIISIRQSTCWTYASRVKKVMETMKKELKIAGDKGWSKLIKSSQKE